MSADLATALFVGLASLLTAVGGLAANRARQRGVTRREYRTLEKRFLASLAHIFRLEEDLATCGRKVPPRPAELEDDDDDPSPSSLAGPRA